MKVILRADGSTEIGLGHVYRLLALAEMLKDQFSVVFAISDPAVFVRKLILSYCTEIIELPSSSSLQEEAEYMSQNILTGSEVLVLDGYNFNTSYQEMLRPYTKTLVCIDDLYAYHFVADAVINHSAGTDRSFYSSEKYTRFFLGFDYALLRKPFLELAKSHKKATDNRNVFISMGGADKNNDVLEVVKKCNKQGGTENYHLVLGSAYLYKTQLEDFVFASGANVQIYRDVTARDMAQLMSICSRGICSPSTVCMEYLCSGGQLFLYQIAENQSGPYRNFVSNGIAKPFELFGINDKNISVAHYIDGKSDERFQKIFHSFF